MTDFFTGRRRVDIGFLREKRKDAPSIVFSQETEGNPETTLSVKQGYGFQKRLTSVMASGKQADLT